METTTTTKMYIVQLLIVLPLLTESKKLSIEGVLSNFEDKISSNSIKEATNGDFQTVDATTQAEVENKDLFSIKGKIRIYPSKGIMVSNHILNLDIPTQKYRSLGTSVDTLLEVSPRDTYVKGLVKKKQKVERFFDSICNLSHDSQRQISKRFIVTVIIATVTSIVTSVSTVAALGAFEDNNLNKEEIDTGIENNHEREDRDEFFLNHITELRKETKSIEARLNLQDQAFTLTRNFDNIFNLLSTITDTESYNFEENWFLNKAQRSITQNERFMHMLNGNKFGLDGNLAMLTLSESDSFVITASQNHKCEKSHLVNKMMTVIPDDEFEAEATEDRYRYKLSEDKSIYINPDLIMEKSRFRPQHTFSKMRTIIAENSKISTILPYNNSVLFVKTDGFFEMTRTCQDLSSTFTVYKDPIFHLPLGCSLTSQYLNVSTFEIFYNNDILDGTTTEVFNFENDLFHPVYDLEEIETEDYMMKQKIHKIFNNAERISQIEMEKFHNRETLEKIKDKASNIVYGIKNFAKSVQDEFILEPLYKILGIIAGTAAIVLIIIVIIVIIWKNKK